MNQGISQKVFRLRPKYDVYEYMILSNETDWYIKKSFIAKIIDNWTELDVLIEGKKNLKKGGHHV